MEPELQTDTVVRPVRDVDAEALGRVHATCWHETYDHLISKAALENVSARRLAELWTHWAQQGPDFRMVAALVNGEIVGFAGSGPARDRDAPRNRELYFIYLLDAWHGTGIGQRLFDAVVPEDDTDLYLWVAEDNPRAHRFYTRNGFTLDGANHTEPFLGETLTEVRFVR
ncbi:MULTISPECIES: GNAT family N-acetyltransferase [Microbacterium]|uniref:GNAT family N-acetyltransferase n=1 Tax=Microbacterium aquilitoris TaxID=3067307 RepID=A0ABU3GLU7_9MICO|nr:MULTISPECIES: GNAT family N-acetyltransferase [unclassified Microbacterium]MDT3331687.1 GNAT family N-acetyltransferase [Microbacterium sp. KSW-18]MDT3346350.1 GNAT family N-acetyltransferase [Microbacterium sp. KSW2-22]SDG67728.1 L-amino acid N-acyltransferase YncA [Microbacterium sp. 77mftsu3.1]